jgi:phage-related protein
MEKDINVTFLSDAAEFLDSLDEASRKKVFFNISKTKAGLRGEWFEKMIGTDEIWEFRTLYNKQYIRLFAFWLSTKSETTLIICTHGLIKKTAKTPASEIEKAERLKQEYLKDKKPEK